MRDSKEGIIVGCDGNQEWLLPWWWDHYCESNAYQVAFADYGMSESAAAWCREKGLYFKAPEIDRTAKEHLSQERQKLWEEHYGKGIWFHRELCLRKPFTMLASPFPFSIWLDVDCRVRGNLEPLFQLLRSGSDIGMKKEPDRVLQAQRKKGFIIENEAYYNSGVIPYRIDAKILGVWASLIRENSGEFIFDQHAFSRALHLEKASMLELSALYNWSPGDGSNSEALVYHFHGGFKDPAFMYFFN